MTFNPMMATCVIEIAQNRDFTSVIEMGSQRNTATKGTTAEFYASWGITEYASIDFNSASTICHDLNLPYEDQPEYVLMLSWHIADDLIPKIREKGYKGKFIIPLPEPRIID